MTEPVLKSELGASIQIVYSTNQEAMKNVQTCYPDCSPDDYSNPCNPENSCYPETCNPENGCHPDQWCIPDNECNPDRSECNPDKSDCIPDK